MSRESVIKAKEEVKTKKIEEEKAVAKPPIEKEGEIKVARVKKPAEVSVPLKRERKTGFGLFSFQRIKISTLTSTIRIKLLPIFVLKIELLQLLKVKALSIAKSPKFQLHRPSAIRVQNLESIKARSLQTSHPTLYITKPTNIRTQILNPIKARVSLQTLTPELSIPPSAIMKLLFPKLFKVKLSKSVQSPQLKFSPTKTPAPSRILLKRAPKVKSRPSVSFGIRKEVPTEETPILIHEGVEAEVSEAPKPEVAIEAAPGEEELGILKLLFEPTNEEHGLGGVLHVRPERPILVMAEKVKEEEYLEALKHILREVYRIKVGGLPIARHMAVGKRRVEEDVEAGKHITVIDDAKGGFLKFFRVKSADDFEKGIDVERFREESIAQLFSQPFGFLVLHAETKRMKQVITYLSSVEEQIPKICMVKPKKLATEDKLKVIRALWGFVKPAKETSRNLGEYFLACENTFWDSFEKLVKTPKYMSVRESVEDEEGLEGYESPMHYLTKVFIVKYFIEKLDLEDIQTEVKLTIPNGREVVPDVYIPETKLAVEVETLYGVGMVPWMKLRRTIEKYENSGVSVWIVVPNLQLALYLKGIREIAESLKKDSKPIEFYTLNTRHNELVKLDEYVETLKTCVGIKGLTKIL